MGRPMAMFVFQPVVVFADSLRDRHIGAALRVRVEYVLLSTEGALEEIKILAFIFGNCCLFRPSSSRRFCKSRWLLSTSSPPSSQNMPL